MLVFCVILVMAKFGPETVDNYSGYVDVHGKSRKLFYWAFESRRNAKEDPALVVLSGGPGYSGMVSLLAKNGPYRLNKDGELDMNDDSWNSKANVVWFDQPAPTGFSTVEEGKEEAQTQRESALDTVEAIHEFLKSHEQFQGKPLTLVAESYAALSAPIVAQELKDKGVNLTGLVFVSGLVDPQPQFKSYPAFALDKGVVSPITASIMAQSFPMCDSLVQACEITATLWERQSKEVKGGEEKEGDKKGNVYTTRENVPPRGREIASSYYGARVSFAKVEDPEESLEGVSNENENVHPGRRLLSASIALRDIKADQVDDNREEEQVEKENVKESQNEQPNDWEVLDKKSIEDSQKGEKNQAPDEDENNKLADKENVAEGNVNENSRTSMFRRRMGGYSASGWSSPNQQWVGNNDQNSLLYHAPSPRLGRGHIDDERHRMLENENQNSLLKAQAASEEGNEDAKVGDAETENVTTNQRDLGNRVDVAVRSLACSSAAAVCKNTLVSPVVNANVHPLDISKSNQDKLLDIDAIEEFFRKPEVQKALGAESMFTAIDKDVLSTILLRGDWTRDYTRLLPNLVNSGVRLLIVNGERDFITNWYGTGLWLEDMDWPLALKTKSDKVAVYGVDQRDNCGNVECPEAKKRDAAVKRVTFIKVADAGHLVEVDQPEIMKTLITDFANGN